MRGLVISIAVVALAAIVGAGAYQLGIAQGLAAGGQAVPAVAPYLYGYHPFGFGFGIFGLLFPLLFFFLIFAVIAGAARRAAWGSHESWGRGPRMFDEWHRQAHAEPTDRTADRTAPRT